MDSKLVVLTDADISMAEKIEIHTEWWGKCVSCRHWQTRVTVEHRDIITRSKDPGACGFQKSPLFGQETWIEGQCEWWDSFDVDAAIAVMALP